MKLSISGVEIDRIKQALEYANRMLTGLDRRVIILENDSIKIREGYDACQQRQEVMLQQLSKLEVGVSQIMAQLSEQKSEERERAREQRSSLLRLKNTIYGVLVAAMLTFLSGQILPNIQYNTTSNHGVSSK